ncbi:uncharacterized protein LOC124654134 [Lolium rigidum]|uniref:uncharacterized protein LOC124654134 n=1 Tax=Lolium rigidum TaxID=89674 RepID=UPI001F5D3B50|nr:uncharacterized protein LOC124654134 [Lolium rigidum]
MGCGRAGTEASSTSAPGMSGNSSGPLEATRRFWAISPEEDSDDKSPAAGATSSLALYYSTPVEDDGRDLASTSLSAVDRREQKRQRQRAAALELRPGYPASCSFNSAMGVTSPYGAAGGYGYWMQPDATGCSGLLFPGYWVAAS